FTGVHFAAYEAAKKILSELYPDQAGDDHLLTHVAAGGTAGALASGITTPFDVVKTRLQCQGVCGATKYSTSSVTQVVKEIVRREGSAALFKGLKPRVLFHTPAAAISWSTYEAVVSRTWEANYERLYCLKLQYFAYIVLALYFESKKL
ncbi:mitoferrin, partial [Selaginella moellendorffii]